MAIVDFNKYSIGGGGGTGSDPNAVKYTEQELTDAQKAQARTNIGSPSVADLENVQSEEYITVASLPTAAAGTMGKIYLVGPDANDEYARYITSFDGTNYTWTPIGTTDIDLSGYATTAQLSQLDQDVNGKSFPSYTANGTTSANTFLRSNIDYTDIQIDAGVYNLSAVLNGTFDMIAIYLFDSNGDALTLKNKNGQNVQLVGSDVIGAQSPYTIPSGTVRVGFHANNKITDGSFSFGFENTATPVKGLSEKVEDLGSEIGEPDDDESRVISGTMTAGASFSSIGTAVVDIPTGTFVKMELSGTATASTIRVYANAAPNLFWANPEMGGSASIQASEQITALILYSDCTTAGTINLEISYTIPGNGIAGDVSAIKKTSVFISGKWAALGDSITAQGKYIGKVVERLGLSSVVNLGIGGITIVNNGGSTYMSKDDYLAQIPNDSNLITIMGGMNDWAQSAPIGEINSTDTTEYCGALNHIIDYVTEHYQTIMFVVACPTLGVAVSRFGGDGLLNNIGKTTLDYAGACLKVCEARGVPCAKVGQQMGWTAKNISSFTENDGANIHPNAVGGERIANVLSGYIRTII